MFFEHPKCYLLTPWCRVLPEQLTDPKCYVMKIIIVGSKFQIRVFCLKHLKKTLLDFI